MNKAATVLQEFKKARGMRGVWKLLDYHTEYDDYYVRRQDMLGGATTVNIVGSYVREGRPQVSLRIRIKELMSVLGDPIRPHKQGSSLSWFFGSPSDFRVAVINLEEDASVARLSTFTKDKGNIADFHKQYDAPLKRIGYEWKPQWV